MQLYNGRKRVGKIKLMHWLKYSTTRLLVFRQLLPLDISETMNEGLSHLTLQRGKNRHPLSVPHTEIGKSPSFYEGNTLHINVYGMFDLRYA